MDKLERTKVSPGNLNSDLGLTQYVLLIYKMKPTSSELLQAVNSDFGLHQNFEMFTLALD